MYLANGLHEPAVQALGDTPLWRYMGLDEFLGLLTHERLWLSCIATMKDQTEGLYFCDSTHDGQMAKIAERNRLECCISCWCAHPDEALPLWESRTAKRDVVVKSDVQSIVKSLGTHDEDNVFFGKIKYLSEPPDINSLRVDVMSYSDALFFKNSAFAHENEIRLVAQGVPGMGRRLSLANLNSKPTQRSSGVKVDLRHLIHEVRVSPFSESWLHDVVDKTMKMVGLNEAVVACSALSQSFKRSTLCVDAPTFSHGPPAQSEATNRPGLYEKTKDGYRRIT